MGHKVIIIGAGISGLSAGCYLQMNGYDTEIYELHYLPGGLCTSWDRKGYTIDNCIHWLVGSGPTDNFYKLWNELIDMKSLQFVDHEEYIRVEDANGKCIRVFTDVDRLEKEMLEKAPEDKDLIIRFTKAVRKCTKLNMPVDKAPQLYNLLDGIKMVFKFLPYMRSFKKWGGISAGQLADKCKNPLLKKTFEFMFLPKMVALFLITTLAWMNKKSAGYPVGGSLKFAELIEKKYIETGGKINYRAKVKKIITEGDSSRSRAKGIILENGESHYADTVISAADGHNTIFEMLDGMYVDKKIKNYYENFVPFPSYLRVSLGVSKAFEDEPHEVFFPLEKPIVIDDSVESDYVWARIFNFDPTFAPEGKTVMTTILLTRNYEYWDNLRQKDREKYRAEKDRIANDVIEAFEKRFKNIKSNLEMVDVSTPSTVIRYTNNWKGSFEGWIMTPGIGFKQMKKVLRGLDNFYMIGQWVEPGGGVPTGLMSGRNITQIMCKRDKKTFVTQK